MPSYQIKDKIKIKDDNITYKILDTRFIGFAEYALIEDIKTFETKEIPVSNIIRKVQ